MVGPVSRSGPLFVRFDAMLRVFLQSGRAPGFGNRQALTGQHPIGKGEQRKQLRGILGQAAIADFKMREQALDGMEGMLDFLPAQCPSDAPSSAPVFLGQCLVCGALHGHVRRHRFADFSGYLSTPW